MIRKMMRNLYVGRYGEDLVFSRDKKEKNKYRLFSFALRFPFSKPFSYKTRQDIIQLYCELGVDPNAIDKTNLSELKLRAKWLASAANVMICNYLESKEQIYLDEVKKIYADVEVLQLSDNQYDEWFHKMTPDEMDVLDIKNKLKDERKQSTIK